MPTVLSLLAHPDDAEFACAGTLARLRREHGWKVHVATMTAGDCGSADLTPDEISAVRRGEGAAAAEVIGAAYHRLEERDLCVAYTPEAVRKASLLLCEVRPDVVLTHPPADYHVDHEMTSLVARAACFAAPIPNFTRGLRTGSPLGRVPHLYYCDPMEGKDPLGRAVQPDLRVDVSDVIEVKAEMLARHASQRDWLLKHHGMDQYIEEMKRGSARRGREAGVRYAEGSASTSGTATHRTTSFGKTLGVV